MDMAEIRVGVGLRIWVSVNAVIVWVMIVTVSGFTITFTICGGLLPPNAEASSGPNAQPKCYWNLLEVLANLKKVAQCSCLSSHGLGMVV